MKIGSLFSGIGGLELGLECALRDGGFDVETTWQCEADEWCRGVLARHWPSALRYDDVRGVGPDAPAVDVLCGGFPCQDVSYAGRGAGLAGERSGLWREFARIIRDLRPRIVVVENVAALLSRGLGDVLGDLAACGYDAQWFCVRASDVGAPHQRDRLFVVADAGSQRPQGELRARPAARTALRRGAVSRATQSGVGRAAHGLPRGMDITCHRWPVGPDEAPPAEEPPRVSDDRRERRQRLKALGNAVVPQVAYAIGCVVVELLRGGAA